TSVKTQEASVPILTGFSLLPASLLAFWGLCTAAQLTIESVPFNAVEGKDVLLLVHNTRENLLVYRWFKGERSVESFGIATYAMTTQVNTPGPAHSDVTQNDSGFYTLQTMNPDLGSEEASGQLHSTEPVTWPSIQATNTTVTEQESVVLTCLSADTGISIRWIFNNQSLWLMERMNPSQDNRSLSIDPVRREDARECQCEVSNPASSSKWPPQSTVTSTFLMCQE
uniref:Ig-like domain-containing protein n=1 Tax=Castor canadensis TaxID=51338 RepID=A0A8C0W893_CASCN